MWHVVRTWHDEQISLTHSLLYGLPHAGRRSLLNNNGHGGHNEAFTSYLEDFKRRVLQQTADTDTEDALLGDDIAEIAAQNLSDEQVQSFCDTTRDPKIREAATVST